jgi:hypothetical protein
LSWRICKAAACAISTPIGETPKNQGLEHCAVQGGVSSHFVGMSVPHSGDNSTSGASA